MCPPAFFGVAYEINPWMHTMVTVDRDRAYAQWESLVALLQAAGATVHTMEPEPGVPDLVFTANAGVVQGDVFVPARFRHPERQPESAFDIAWFAAHDFTVRPLPEGVFQEGAGDALPFDGVLLSGYRFRSDAAAHADLGRILGVEVLPIELVDPALYHLDLTFCPLDERRAIIAPSGWDVYGRRLVEARVPEPLILTPEEARAFCANSVVVGDRVIMPSCPPRVGRILEGWGFTVAECDVSEFLKAGGACKCLTLAVG